MIILYILLALGFITIGILAYQSDKHLKWFNSLQPGDQVLVRIYSKYCECARVATVTVASDGKYIQCTMSEQVSKDCKDCAAINGRDSKGNNTCWHHVTYYKRKDISKVTDKAKIYTTLGK